mgnify:CR=1 FL=1
MKKNSLLALAAVAVVVIALAVLTSPSRHNAAQSRVGKRIFRDIPLNDIETVVIASGSSTANLAKVNGAWVAPDKYSYPADFGRIRDTLVKIAELKIGQTVSLDEKQKAKLKLRPPSASASADGAGTLVTLLGSGNREIASLLLGETRERKAAPRSDFPFGGGYPDGRYVSPDRGKTVYLVSDTLSDITPQIRDWLETEILNVSGSDIRTISIRHPDKPELRLSRAAEGSALTVEGLAADEETDTTKLYSLESALSYLRFADVADPGLPDSETGMDKPTVFEATTGKGQVFTARIGAAPTNRTERYVKFDVALRPADTNAAPGGDTNAVAKAAEERKKLEEETATLKSRLAPWIYLVESYKTDAMTTQRDAVVKKKEPPKEEKKDGGSEPAPSEQPEQVNAAAPADTEKDKAPPAQPVRAETAQQPQGTGEAPQQNQTQ